MMHATLGTVPFGAVQGSSDWPALLVPARCVPGRQVGCRTGAIRPRTRSSLLPHGPAGTATPAAVPRSNRPARADRPKQLRPDLAFCLGLEHTLGRLAHPAEVKILRLAFCSVDAELSGPRDTRTCVLVSSKA